MTAWLTIEDVADALSVDPDVSDERLVLSTAAAKAAVERRRADLVYTDAGTVPADVRLAAIEWAGVMYQGRSAPSGFSGYDAETALAEAGSKRADILRRLGWRRPVTG